jgi:inner membrane protein
MPQITLDPAKLPGRSMGLKLIFVCFLALVMSIPALFVWALIEDRSRRAQDVTTEVTNLVGGPQTFLGPVLAVPYQAPQPDGKPPRAGAYVVFPVHGEAEVNTRAEERHRSLFKVPVYQSDIAFNASFEIPAAASNLPKGVELDWTRAQLGIAASDARGAHSDITLTADGKSSLLGPANANLTTVTVNLPNEGYTNLTFFGTRAVTVAEPGGKFDVKVEMKFTGAQRLTFLAFGRTTTVTMKGDWPHPSFNGGVLPVTQNVTPAGFDATWSVPFIARNVPADGAEDIVDRLGRTAMGVSFVELADPYQSVTRSLKYAVLFIGLVFLSYFLFEVTSGRRVHPAQYILIGVAQLIFYLLLLSIAERIGFDLAFLIAALATVGLISVYATWVFESKFYGLRALGLFSALYGLIYLLLRLEDEALLVGAIASFLAIAAVMYLTRRMDWYGTPTVPNSDPAPTVGGGYFSDR